MAERDMTKCWCGMPALCLQGTDSNKIHMSYRNTKVSIHVQPNDPCPPDFVRPICRKHLAQFIRKAHDGQTGSWE